MLTTTHSQWPKPPSSCCASQLYQVPAHTRVCVTGLVILRQRPGTAKGVIFVTLEDETGTVNIVVWPRVFELYRQSVISARLMRVTGRLQRAYGVTHVIAEKIEDISPMLDQLLAPV